VCWAGEHRHNSGFSTIFRVDPLGVDLLALTTSFLSNARSQMPANGTVPPKAKSEVQSLACRYGKIGISAVAAAMRYQSEPKNLAYAPVAPHSDYWGSEGFAA
jgi:hypothetical protein